MNDIYQNEIFVADSYSCNKISWFGTTNHIENNGKNLKITRYA